MPETKVRKRRAGKLTIKYRVYYGRGGGYQECRSITAVGDFIRYYLKSEGPSTFTVEKAD